MATVTKTIGTASRDYSTITAWEADLDTGSIYSSGDDAVGECYNDSAFDETFTMNGGGTVGLNSVKLSVASGQRHDGTEGSGARIVRSSSADVIDFRVPSGFNQKYTLEWIELDMNGQGGLPINGESSAYANVGIIRNIIVHGANGANAYRGFIHSGGRAITLSNSIFYDHTRNSGLYCRGITIDMDRTEALIANCTIYGVSNPSTTAAAYGIIPGGGDSGKIKNNIVMNITTGGTGENPCFSGTALTGGKADYNMSDDDTADDLGGSNNLINKSNSTQFVSTVSGSEDLHIVSTSDAVGAGEDLATTSVDINGSDRNALAATIWDIGAHQYASTASIGTSSRDYSTIALWEADLDDTTIYGAGANAVGECYNDSNFTASATINGGGTVGLSSITLTVHPDHRHDGTVGTGAHVTYSAGSNSPAFKLSIANTLVEWFSVKLNGTGNYGNPAIVDHTHNINYTTSRYIVGEGDTTERINSPNNGINVYGNYTKSHNNIIYNYMMANATSAGIYDHYGSSHEVYNNTVYNCPYGYNWTMRGNTTMKNNLVVGNNYADFTKGDHSGTAVSSNNLSSDSTATVNGGSNHVTGASVSRQFVSTLSGSEDLHLIFKSAAIDAGVDLGTTPDGVQYDINGKNRDAENSIWDIGAHEYGDNVVFGLLRV